MPLVRLRHGDDAPYLACWLDDARKGDRTLRLVDPISSDVPHLAEGGAEALLYGGSRAHPNAFAEVCAYVGVDAESQYSINLRGSWRAFDAGRRGLAVRVKYGRSHAALRFNCRPDMRPNDDDEWRETITLKNADRFAESLRDNVKPTLSVQIAAMQDQEGPRSELQNVAYFFEFRMVPIDKELYPLARVTCPLPAIVLSPGDATAAAAEFPPRPLSTRVSAAERSTWPFAMVVAGATRKAEVVWPREAHSSTWTSAAREERSAASTDFGAPTRTRSRSGERREPTLDAPALKVPAVRLAEERQARSHSDAPSLSIRGAASRIAAAQEAEAKIEEARDAEARRLRRQARERRYEELERENRHRHDREERSLSRSRLDRRADEAMELSQP